MNNIPNVQNTISKQTTTKRVTLLLSEEGLARALIRLNLCNTCACLQLHWNKNKIIHTNRLWQLITCWYKYRLICDFAGTQRKSLLQSEMDHSYLTPGSSQPKGFVNYVIQVFQSQTVENIWTQNNHPKQNIGMCVM